MRKIAIVIFILMIPIIATATIQNIKINEKIASSIRQTRISAVNCEDNLKIIRSNLIDIKNNYTSELDAADITKLTAYFNDLQNTINQLNVLISGIDTNFPSIKE